MGKLKRKDHVELADEQPVTPQMVGDTTVGNADRDRLASRAYELYQARGGSDGMDLEDWLAAERELTNGHRPTDE
jgi:hypothetical protein